MTDDQPLQLPIDGVLDLHTFRPNEVKDLVTDYLAECRARGIPVVVCGGAGGRQDPSQLRVADLARSTHDRLLQKVREQLRRGHGFPRGDELFGVECIYSPEAPVFPQTDGSVCAQPEAGVELRLNCDLGYGTASFVTGAFGFLAASLAVRRIASRS